MILASLTSATRTSRLIACSQLACVVLFGSLLLAPWRALSPTLGATFILASMAFALAAVSIARGTAGLVRLVFVAFALLATLAGFGEAWLLFVPTSPRFIALHELSSLELAVAMAALNGLLALYGSSVLSVQRTTAEELQSRVSAEQLLKASLEQRVVQRTLELDDAQRVLHRMWWLGQQITLELDPRRVLERFLEAAADVAQADGATLGLLADDSMIELTAGSGVLASLAGDKVPVTGSAMGRIIRSGGSWSVADVRDHHESVERSWFERAVDPVRGMAVVPVQRRGERVGAVVIVSTKAHTFSLLELERVEAMADLLSVALANAELFQTMKREIGRAHV